MMEEIWKDIEGYEGLYQVSNLGRVRSLDRVVNRINPRNGNPLTFILRGVVMKQHKNKGGYMRVSLKIKEPHRTCLVHRLVAKAFIPNPNNLPEVNHKNQVRNDNRAENLEWCTSMYNMHYGDCQHKIYEGQHFKAINVYTKDGKFINRYDSIAKASEETGVSTGRISFICQGGKRNGETRHSAKGYKFKYSE